MYEIIKCEDGITFGKNPEIEFKIETLRKYFDCENKYSAFKDFRIRVIEVAVREINSKSDLFLIPTYKKSGRAVTSILFEIHIQKKQTSVKKTLQINKSNKSNI